MNKQLQGLDAQEAFDSVKWDFLGDVLSVFNFSETFVRIIDTLFQNSTAGIKINGTLSNFFQNRERIQTGLSNFSVAVCNIY